jgi:hypothetical protein
VKIPHVDASYHEGILHFGLASFGLTLVRHAEPHYGVHRHMDGGEVICSVAKTTVHLRWRGSEDE